MNGYRRITPRDRCQIEILKESGFSARAIAKKLEFAPSTVIRELRKSKGTYRAELAEDTTQKRTKRRYSSQFKIGGQTERVIRRKLILDWSPEQISGWLRKECKIAISFKSIYRYIERDKKAGGKLTKHLRILRKQRKDRKKPRWTPFIDGVPGRTFLTDRPKIVEKRKRLGDIERDTVFGKRNGALLLTMVDRTSRYVYLELVKRKCSKLIHEATVRALRYEKIKTITNDNGTEFAKHRETAKTLKTEIYFSRAYASWERGTNENTNGLIRQYLPRKRDMGFLTKFDVKALAKRLNNRPRKCLDYQTPAEVHRRLKAKARVLR